MTTLPLRPDSHMVAFRTLLGDTAEIATMLALEGAVRRGHFRLLSGVHTDHFLAFSAIAADAENLHRISGWLGPSVDAWRPEAVVAPSTAGVGLAAALARRISAPLHLASVGVDGRPTHLVGSALPPGARVLVVNDVTTTGTAVDTLAHLVHSDGATVAGAAWFASRSLEPAARFAFPTVHIIDVDLPAYQPDGCALCTNDVPDIEDAIDLN